MKMRTKRWVEDVQMFLFLMLSELSSQCNRPESFAGTPVTPVTGLHNNYKLLHLATFFPRAVLPFSGGILLTRYDIVL